MLGSTASAEGTFRLILPTGATTRNLVPAVGGGFRGLVRASGSTKIAGQARLVPAAAGAGATALAGPLIATVGLAVVGNMLADHQTTKKFGFISKAVSGIHTRMDENEQSVISTASQQAQKVMGYLMDQAQLPSISSASYAFGELDNLTNTYIARLDRWLEIADHYSNSKHVYAPELMEKLINTGSKQPQDFEHMVYRTYESLALRARVVVLEKIAAEFSNGDHSLHHIEGILQGELSSIAQRQSQLVDLLDDLSVLPIDSSKVPINFAGKGTLDTRTSFARMARALHSSPQALPVLTDSDQTILEVCSSSDGYAVDAPEED